MQKQIREAFDQYQFAAIYQLIHNFCSVELSSFYLDVIKDRQYTIAKNAHARRSSQTALYYLCEIIVRWLAPITSFTADEVWQFMPGKRNESVFLNTWFTDFPDLEKVDAQFWEWMLTVRNEVNKVLESYRAEGKMGSALEAEVVLHVNEADYKKLILLGDELRFILITSDARVMKSDASKLSVEVIVADHEKCARCWHRRADVGADTAYPELCMRCVINITTDGEVRQFA